MNWSSGSLAAYCVMGASLFILGRDEPLTALAANFANPLIDSLPVSGLAELAPLQKRLGAEVAERGQHCQLRRTAPGQ